MQVSKDDRSDIESSSDEEDGPPANQKHHSSTTNGTNKNHGTNGYLTGGTYPDEHWSSCATGIIHPWVCVCVYDRGMNDIVCLVLEVPDRFMFVFISVWLLTKSFTHSLISRLSLHQTAQGLSNECEHSTLQCKHVTNTQSSDPLGVWLFLYFCLSVLFIFYKYFCRQ